MQGYDPDRRVTDGRTAVVAASLEDRLARVDQQIQVVSLLDQRVRAQEALRLWRERVGLLDALVDVHANREGTTIIQVTHSEENARYSRRIVQLKDGWMV